jgi:glutathione S-transferase
MSLKLYAHPFSSYCQKVLIPLYENGTPFEYLLLEPGAEKIAAEHAARWPMKRIPVLVDGDRTVVETTIIIEYLQLHYPGPARMIPADPAVALEVRMLDRFFDNYVMTPMQRIVFDTLRQPQHRNPQDLVEARAVLETAYGWLDKQLAGREWATGDFSLADCAAAPSLFYADWVHPIGEKHPNVAAYRRRLLARPSFARAVDEARPYRKYFPPGAPDRD